MVPGTWYLARNLEKTILPPFQIFGFFFSSFPLFRLFRKTKMAARAKRGAAPDYAKQLIIKINVCKRMQKEVAYYHQEAAENEKKVQDMKQAGKDAWEMKQWEEVLAESHMMIPDSTKRFEQSLEDLLSFLEEHATDETVAACGEKIEEAKQILQTNGLAYQEDEEKQKAMEDGIGGAANEDFKEGEIF